MEAQKENNQRKLRKIIVQDVIEMCSVKGLVVKKTDKIDEIEYIHAPISLFPTPYPAKFYKNALSYQKSMGVMVSDLVRQSPKYIGQMLQKMAEGDVLMSKMLQISETFNQTEKRQKVQVCILRNDYMIDYCSDSLKLVEFNTIACSFGVLCQKVGEMQKYVSDKYGSLLEYNYTKEQIVDDHLGRSYIKDLASVFKRALDQYLISLNREAEIESKKIWVLFVVEKSERNVCDQKWIEAQLYEDHQIHSMRMSLSEIYRESVVNPETNTLVVREKEIGFVYYRTGYQIEQYEDENDWKAREILECTKPIKCPSIDVHLTTFKKFQQAFGNEAKLKEVMGDSHEEEADIIKHLFKGIWSMENLEDTEVQEIMKKAIENPHDFVIKPMKEGGGNNFYDEEVKLMLLQENKELLKPFLIMERINPPEIKAYMLRNGQILEPEALSELGIFSSVFIDSEQRDPIENVTIGRLLRTKGNHSNEGGVNTGFSVIDQPLIVDIQNVKTISPVIKDF